MKNKIIYLNTVILVVIVLIFHINKSQVSAFLYEYVSIFKCCPNGSELKVTDGQDGKRTYDCALTKGNNEENRTLFGYNFYISDEDQIPNCGDVEIFDFDEDGGLISSDGCIDWYNGVLHGLTCSDKFQVEVHKLYKCCPEGFSYDITNRECILSQQAPEDFVNLIGSSVAIFQTEVPTCQVNQIFVEYQTDIHPSVLIRSGIKLSTTELEFLEPGTFCIDGIVNVDIDGNTTNIRSKQAIIIRSCRPRNRCREIPCVRRCCSNEEIMERIDGKVQCVNYTKNIKPIFHDVRSFSGFEKSYRIVEPSVYGLINKQECNKFKLSSDDPKDVHYISHIDGSLYVNNFDEPFSNNDYCVELVKMDTIDIHGFICFTDYSTTKYKYYAAGLTVSCVFLAVTLICYACLPKVLLLNLHGKTLVCYVISLLSAYISLAIVQFHTETQIEHCLFIAYLIFFGFLAAFCWQSIMCFDIWWTFGSVRTSRGMRKTKELRRFLLYSLYAWGVPTLLTSLTILVDQWHLIPDLWSPQLGANNVCWFAPANWRGHFIFFLFPIGLHIFTNAVLFILTAIHCNKVKNEINRMQCSKDNEVQDKKRKFLADKAKYTMNIKLCIVMGVSWSLEILATILQKYEQLWYAADWFNILQGVFVFFIFVFKVKVWEAIQHRLGRAPKRTKGPTTVTTQLSVTSNGKLGKSSSTSTLSTSNTNLNVIRKVV